MEEGLRDITVQGELCTMRHDGTARWHNDTFTTTLRRTLGAHAISTATLDFLDLAAGQMYHILPSARLLVIHSIMQSSTYVSGTQPLESPIISSIPPTHPLRYSINHTQPLSCNSGIVSLLNQPDPQAARTCQTPHSMHYCVPHTPPGCSAVNAPSPHHTTLHRRSHSAATQHRPSVHTIH